MGYPSPPQALIPPSSFKTNSGLVKRYNGGGSIPRPQTDRPAVSLVSYHQLLSKSRNPPAWMPSPVSFDMTHVRLQALVLISSSTLDDLDQTAQRLKKTPGTFCFHLKGQGQDSAKFIESIERPPALITIAQCRANSLWSRRAGSNRCIAVLQCVRRLNDH